MLSLIGKLAHACKVLQVGRLFLRRMIDHSTKAKKLDHWIHLTSDFRADLPWVTPPHSHPGITEEAADIGSPGLVVARLEGIAQGLVQDSRAASSQRAYHTAQKSFGSFCASLGIPAVPASEHLLLLYVAHLSQHVCHATVRSYLSAIRHLHLSHGFQDPLKQSGQLELALKGLKRRKPRTADSRLPITPFTLSIIGQSLVRHFDPYDQLLVWAACCLGFFAFMRSGELTVPSGVAFDPGVHLTPLDVAVQLILLFFVPA